MKNKKFTRSLTIILIALSTPLFAWVLLKSLAHNSTSAHDPDPWIQSLVTEPRVFSKTPGENQWAHVIIKDGALFIKNNSNDVVPIGQQPALTSTHVVFFVEGQGPTAAKIFYEYLKENNFLDTALVFSPSDGFLKDVRYYTPNLKLSSGLAYLVRFRMLNELGLANMMATTMSAVWIDESIFSGSIADLVEQFQERRVPVFVNGPKTAELSGLPVNVLSE
jgi:hypothetical protein